VAVLLAGGGYTHVSTILCTSEHCPVQHASTQHQSLTAALLLLASSEGSPLYTFPKEPSPKSSPNCSSSTPEVATTPMQRRMSSMRSACHSKSTLSGRT
jgi:hypothetical protein